MTFIELLTKIFEICIIPLLGILTTYIVSFLRNKSKELSAKINNETLNTYLNMLTDTITNCVIATNQTYVDSLKSQGKFDAEAQKRAFETTKNAVLLILTDEVKSYLSTAIGDIDAFIDNQIEAVININK